MKRIASARECFFDTEFLELPRTTATLRLHAPTPREVVMEHDAPWEGNGCGYHNFFFDKNWHGTDGKNENGSYRMYYSACNVNVKVPESRPDTANVICYAESPDGIHWTKPDLGISLRDGSAHNNIILGDEREAIFGGFSVFYDDTPGCPDAERYKAAVAFQSIHAPGTPNVLTAYYSADGIHFDAGRPMEIEGKFDTLNVVFRDAASGCYRAYVRDFHAIPEGHVHSDGTRDVRMATSADFIHWTLPEQIRFSDPEDFQLYTNVVSPYDRAPGTYIGFPNRYAERAKEWCPAYEGLCGKEIRRARMEIEPREGLALHDCVFMFSRDGLHFTKYNEAFLRPGPENGHNWVYGDCFMARGFFPSSDGAFGVREMSFLSLERHLTPLPCRLRRYTIREDGFVSLYAGYAGGTAVTKPFVFSGSRLFVNFSTSALGGVTLSLSDGKTTVTSCELFGDSVDREVPFDAALSSLAGKEVTLTVTLRDADLYSLRFAEAE